MTPTTYKLHYVLYITDDRLISAENLIVIKLCLKTKIYLYVDENL